MPRPIWNGNITFGLVNVPVILYSAENQTDIRFNLVDRRDKARIRYVRINEETGKEVPWEEISKGYEYTDHKYILLSDADLKTIAQENSKTIDIECFVPADSINIMEFSRPYYLIPDKKGEKGYVILRETLKNTKKIGITKVIIHTHQYLAALLPYQNTLLLNLLRYPSELKKLSEFDFPTAELKKYKINPKELDIAKQLIHSMSTDWRPEKYHDEYQEILKKWINAKIKKHPKQKKAKAKAAEASNVIDFIDLLKKSIEKNKNKPKKTHSRGK